MVEARGASPQLREPFDVVQVLTDSLKEARAAVKLFKGSHDCRKRLAVLESEFLGHPPQKPSSDGRRLSANPCASKDNEPSGERSSLNFVRHLERMIGPANIAICNALVPARIVDVLDGVAQHFTIIATFRRFDGTSTHARTMDPLLRIHHWQ